MSDFDPFAEWDLIATLEWCENYEWDESSVFRKPNGALVGAHDAGCSCNEPFDYLCEADFIDVRTERDIDHLVAQVTDPDPLAASEFRRKVREALNA